MAAKRNKTRVLLLTALLLVLSVAHADVTQDDVILLSKKQVSLAVAALAKQVAHCEEQEKSNSVPMVNFNVIKLTDESRLMLLNGLAYLKFKNNRLCEKNTRNELVYNLGKLAFIFKSYQMDTKQGVSIQEGLLYPSMKEIKLAVSFQKLPENIKKHLNKITGDKPFDLIKAFKANGLNKH